ncbi:rhodanese-related sulfurtransferase [Sinobaca qinghaiensis]|uniref:Rhodanese-related sulfurtransferase n=1 Tax=Sinobaca qinghaiensis TaxID=342944 RepID=A0A419UWD9_9BACL|nr:rhodanese-like domain-containing protein [Sinobaca qinghaiensis]RKD69449.1 rhodanese-related sulfurtransferase [Sinobaca qinghaiensis]
MTEKQTIRQITPNKVEASADARIIDVREPNETAAGHIPGADLIPLGELLTRLDELNKDTEYTMVCRSGSRSGLAAEWLQERGYRVKNMQGGMLEWSGKTK